MKYTEARDAQECLQELTFILANGSRIPRDRKMINKLLSSLGVAVRVLQKQISAEPAEIDDKNLSEIWYTCPNCHGDLTHIRSSYCGFCGQKLKWNDNEQK